jgi:hypothetical protein
MAKASKAFGTRIVGRREHTRGDSLRTQTRGTDTGLTKAENQAASVVQVHSRTPTNREDNDSDDRNVADEKLAAKSIDKTEQRLWADTEKAGAADLFRAPSGSSRIVLQS